VAGDQGSGDAGTGVPRHEDFDAFYETGTPPWEIGRPQKAFAALADAGFLNGRVLDVGCGTGEHALLAAGRGFEAIGIDAAPNAIRRARQKASERGLTARFEVWDALELPAFGVRFETVLDCGVFHVFDDDDRARYVESLAGVVEPGGRCAVLCFSNEQPGDWGPRRIHSDELRASVAPSWRVDAIEASVLEITLSPEGAIGWLGTFTRR
jgi:SAM-dependent methyltransferase